ncbi:hypothetical protein QR685DRAFT_435372 [Neurospora intermedia]|uniref:Uncharacterized protein n=1 Tax=Neurospora intermedia TaxID=5142 RepID=A0ABR3DLN7_NEUIN
MDIINAQSQKALAVSESATTPSAYNQLKHKYMEYIELNVSTFNPASVDNAITFTFAAFRNASGSSINGSADSACFGR